LSVMRSIKPANTLPELRRVGNSSGDDIKKPLILPTFAVQRLRWLGIRRGL
jgi:hypothetical protein